MKEYIDSILNHTLLKPKTLLEIGSLDARDAKLLADAFDIPSKDVYVVEANPAQYRKIVDGFDYNIFNYAIYNKEGKMPFNQIADNQNNGVSSLKNRPDQLYDKLNANTIEVDTIRGETLLKEINYPLIDICKIDTEGCTFEVLESFSYNIQNIHSFHLEHEHWEVWENQKLYEDIKRYMKGHGYEQIYFKYCGHDKKQSDSVWVKWELMR